MCARTCHEADAGNDAAMRRSAAAVTDERLATKPMAAKGQAAAMTIRKLLPICKLLPLLLEADSDIEKMEGSVQKEASIWCFCTVTNVSEPQMQ